MYNTHSYFSLKSLGKKVNYTWQNTVVYEEVKTADGSVD